MCDLKLTNEQEFLILVHATTDHLAHLMRERCVLSEKEEGKIPLNRFEELWKERLDQMIGEATEKLNSIQNRRDLIVNFKSRN